MLVHGVALKPGKPLCLAVASGKPIAVLPGFPDLGDLHLPRVRRAGDPRARRSAAGAAETVNAEVPVRIASEMGRQEFVLVSLVAGDEGPVAFPTPRARAR